jgi:putative flavoprotein involved in K+ transport
MAQPDAEVLVIGAGPAGIATAWHLQRVGIPYAVVDRAPVLADTWSRLYPSLRLNTTRFYSHLPGARFPLSFGLFPTARQYHEYLVRFVHQHRLIMHLGISVERLRPLGAGWEVTTSAGTWHYPFVVSATGRFGNPIWPAIEGLDAFGGLRMHAHDYRSNDAFAGKRVLVVGNGPSGVDIAVDIAQVAQAPVTITMRSGMRVLPRYPYGLPKHLWMMLAEPLPARWRTWLIDRISNANFIDQTRLGIPLPKGDAATSAVPYRGMELVRAIRAGRVQPAAAPLRFGADCVTLEDGSTLQIDAVVLATGYQPVCMTYLDIPLETDGQGWPLREPGSQRVAGHPGLFLIGVYYKGKGAMYNFNVEAALATDEIARARRDRPASADR